MRIVIFLSFFIIAITCRGNVRFARSYVCMMETPTSCNGPISGNTRYVNSLKAFMLKSVPVMFMLKTVPASAKTFFDTDVYGDKELKIATVNKIKQKLRNAILTDPTVAPSLLELAINDALGYDIQTENGGQDGSIAFEVPEEGGDENMKKAIKILKSVQKDLQRTNTVGFGDLVAFGGAEALETAGCGRVTVQVGRFDAKSANTGYPQLSWTDESLAMSTVKPLFQRTGIDPQGIALLLGALGEVKRVVSETLTSKISIENGEESEDEDPLQGGFVPTTFGARDAIYGAKLGKADFGSKYLSSVIKGKGGQDTLGRVLLEDPQVKVFVQKYASNEGAFLKDVPDAYLRLTLVGQAYTNRNS